MTFSIESKFDIGDNVILNNAYTATVLNVQMSTLDNSYKITYLLEYTNGERRWTDEVQIKEKVSDE